MSAEPSATDWSRAAADRSLTSDAVIGEFEKEIERQESILFGVALFFEGISLLFSGQDAVVETYRRQFRNIIRTGKQVSQWARTLLDQARKDPSKTRLLREFNFLPCRDHPDPNAMVTRAKILVDEYDALFPGRNREEGLSEEEMARLMKAAAAKLA